ncbi:unnamed protein product [Phyllotreta striolata]|uniref:Uncharacterized protein n=1 Tax=Phyllotreta striolata TaxID=444603 RepID=A0A9P0DUN6_PHYSR|nr:unnamed protein product [Phyllotreta striolata]
MYSHSKMQLWYPKQTPDSDVSDNRGKRPGARDSLESFTSEDNEPVDEVYQSGDAQSTTTTNTSRTSSPSNSSADAKKPGDSGTISDFIDSNYWREEKVCCGLIFRGIHDEILVDMRFMKACSSRLRRMEISKRRDKDVINI